MRSVRIVSAVLVSLALLGTQASAGMAIKLQFVNHLQAKLPEQDVYVERMARSGKVYRVTAADRNMNAPLFAAARPVIHNPFNAKDLGPFPKGRRLGITVGRWLAASGQGTYSCDGVRGTINTTFTKLAPRGVYTMWYFFTPMPPTSPFLAIELPVGARDGSQNTFSADAAGNATLDATFKPCLQLSGSYLASALAIAWHSDGKTYGTNPGAFGTVSHVQLLMLLPAANGQ